jgi:hypothetical protein
VVLVVPPAWGLALRAADWTISYEVRRISERDYRSSVDGRLTRSYPPPVAVKAATSECAMRKFGVLCFRIASAIKRRGSTIRALGQELQLFQMVTGAPEEIRTPDPQIRSLVLYPAELRARFR